ncbi:MAG: FadR family transcriptional regulator [Chloroflexota bacterium]|nr:FadR family transcriptional regulator [Chloroflexota bacterium]
MRALERQGLGEQVAEHLREMIVEGEIGVGQTLPPERELARQFAVSSTVIREALRTLSTGGLIEIRHGVGSFVTTPDHWRTAEPIATLIRSGRAGLRQVIEIRAIIEIEMSGLAAERHDDALAHMATSTHDPVVHVAADMDFHRALAAGANNPVLALVLRPILAPIQTSMLRGTHLPAAMHQALREHEHIREAVGARDASGARAAMRAHMHTAENEIGASLGALERLGSG